MQLLTFVQRQWIEFFNNKKKGPRHIGKFLKKDHTAISRELKRNTKSGKKYSAITAQKLADLRAKKTNKRRLETDEDLHAYVTEKIRDGMSPEEIAGRLKSKPPAFLQGKYINHESIYQYIYDGEGKFEQLYPYLRRKQRKRKPKRGRKPQKLKITDRVSIHERPVVVTSRSRFGDWETDTVAFKKQKAALSVQYERKAMLLRIHKVPNKTAEETESAISCSIESLPAKLWKTLTYDNGSEGATHKKIKDGYDIETYFCDPYASWQKGGVENINGLIREYLPRDTNMDTITEADIQFIQEKLNNRPRKKLGYLTPNEVINRAIGALNS